jgi:hypothetical protein
LDSEIQKVSLTPPELSGSITFYGRVSPATREDRGLEEDIGSYFGSVAPTKNSILLDSGASIVRMIVLGIRLGFRKIVLVGVDLDGSPYFWERNPRYLDNLQMSRPSNNQKKGKHETLDSRNRPFPVDTMLKMINQYLLSNRKGALFVASPKSLLAEDIPVFEWSEDDKQGDNIS